MLVRYCGNAVHAGGAGQRVVRSLPNDLKLALSKVSPDVWICMVDRLERADPSSLRCPSGPAVSCFLAAFCLLSPCARVRFFFFFADVDETLTLDRLKEVPLEIAIASGEGRRWFSRRVLLICWHGATGLPLGSLVYSLRTRSLSSWLEKHGTERRRNASYRVRIAQDWSSLPRLRSRVARAVPTAAAGRVLITFHSIHIHIHIHLVHKSERGRQSPISCLLQWRFPTQ